jgi:transcriptional regulator with XRE-family HTH domain
MPPIALDSPTLHEISARCIALRDRLSIPQTELARWLGVSPSYISHLERGTQVPSGNVLRLFRELESQSAHSPLNMHEPKASISHENPLVTLSPEALETLSRIEFDLTPETLPLRETEGAIALPLMNDEPTIADRVRAVREHFGIKRPRLAQWMGVSRQYITNIENGKKVSAPVIKLIERLEQDIRDQVVRPVTPATAQTEVPPPEASLPEPSPPEPPPIAYRPRLTAIPLLSLREARGIDAAENADRLAVEHFAFTVGDPHAFALRLSGDAMSPQHAEGELAVVYPHSLPHTGDRVIARLRDDQDGDVVFRIYGATDHGRSIVLSSLNPAYPPITVSREEVIWIYPVAATVRHLLG